MDFLARDGFGGAVSPILAAAFSALAVGAIAYSLLALASLRRFPRPTPQAKPWAAPGVTILKPLYGAEDGLFEHLLTFCRQTYRGPVQILFGVHSAEDAAAPVARRIVALARAGLIDGAPPRLTVELVIDPTVHGGNGKVSNLINLSKKIEQPVVVLADSDISVRPDYLDRLVAALQKPGVGLVTCLYRGRPLAGLWSQLGAMGVDYHFLPNVLTGVALNMAHPCVGATIALRRATLEAIGGFECIKDQLADDYMLGEAVRGLGLNVALADFVVGHAHCEKSFGELWRRDMRWARTIRQLDPAGYFGMAATFPLPWALLAWGSSGFSLLAGGLVGAAALCRALLHRAVDRRFPGPAHDVWLGPIRDVIGFSIFLGSFLPGQVFWRGREFSVADDGVMTEVDQAEVA